MGEATNTPQPFHNKGVSWKQQQWPNKESENGHKKGFRWHTNRQPINSLEFVNNGASTSTGKGSDVDKEKEKLTLQNKEIAGIPTNNRLHETSIRLPDIRNVLIYEDEVKFEQRISKCPEIIIKFNNNISVAALVEDVYKRQSRESVSANQIT